MAKLTLSQLPAALGYLGHDVAQRLVRDVTRHVHGAEPDKKDSLPMEYSRQAKESAMFDFELSTGNQVAKVTSRTLGALELRADGVCMDGTPVLTVTPFRHKGEFESAKEQPKIACKAHYLMASLGVDKCHVVQWTDACNRFDTIDFDADYLERTSAALDAFVEELDFAEQSPARHLAPLYSSRSANMAVESYVKTQREMLALSRRLKKINESLADELPDGEFSIKGHHVIKSNEDIKIC